MFSALNFIRRFKNKDCTNFPLDKDFNKQLEFISESIINYLSGDISPNDLEKILTNASMLSHTSEEIIEFGIDLPLKKLIEHSTMMAAITTGNPVCANFEPISVVGFKKAKQNINHLVKKGVLDKNFTKLFSTSGIRSVFAQDRILSSLTAYRQINEKWLDPVNQGGEVFFNQLLMTGSTEVVFTDSGLRKAFRDLTMVCTIVSKAGDESLDFDLLLTSNELEHVNNFKNVIAATDINSHRLKMQFARHLLLPEKSEQSDENG